MTNSITGPGPAPVPAPENFWQKNQVILSGLVAAIVLSLQQFLGPTPVNWAVIGFAVLLGICTYVGNNWRGKGVSVFGILGVAGYAVTSVAVNGTINLNQLILAFVVGFGALVAPPPKPASYEKAPVIEAAKRTVVILLCLLTIAGACLAQSPFKKLPNLSRVYSAKFGAAVTAVDSVFNAQRFIAGTGYSYPDGNIQAGIGYGIQHLRYTYATQSYYCLWSVSGYVFAGGNVAPKAVSDVAKIAIMGGFLNGAVSIGPYYSIGPARFKTDGSKISPLGVMLITTINFNP